jgi:hypothetical protein
MVQKMYDKNQEMSIKNVNDTFTSFYCVEAFTLDAYLYVSR